MPSSYSARLHPFFVVLERSGCPVARDLDRAGLPVQLMECSDLRFSAPKVYSVLDRMAEREGLEDLALAGALGESFQSIEPRYRIQFQSQPSLAACLDRYFLLMRAYNGRVGARIEEGQRTRIAASDNPAFARQPWHRFSDWSNLMVLIGLVRHVVGQHWSPREITLQSSAPVSTRALASFPNTHIRIGHPLTSFTIEQHFLATSMPKAIGAESRVDRLGPALPSSFPDLVIALIRPYLGLGLITSSRR